MKRSQLRKIIKESIKRLSEGKVLLTEQYGGGNYGLQIINTPYINNYGNWACHSPILRKCENDTNGNIDPNYTPSCRHYSVNNWGCIVKNDGSWDGTTQNPNTNIPTPFQIGECFSWTNNNKIECVVGFSTIKRAMQRYEYVCSTCGQDVNNNQIDDCLDCDGATWNGSIPGCLDCPNCTNYGGNLNPPVNVDDGSCLGCTDPNSNNYEPNADIDDGSCGTPGCTDPTANNYDPLATTDDGSCTYDVPGCMGNYPGGANGNCVVGSGPYSGQPYSYGVMNFDPSATVDDGSCIPLTYGCTDQNAVNYYAGACVSDPNSCIYFGCTDTAAFNYDPVAVICSNGTPTDCCEYEGCTDSTATNYDSNADGCLDATTGLLDPNNYDCCTYVATSDCDPVAWKNHVWNTYSVLNGDPMWQSHFCEFCIDGTIPPLTDAWCKCCDPVVDPCEAFNAPANALQAQMCCNKCAMTGGNLPPGPCHTLTDGCNCCQTNTGTPQKGCIDPNAINHNQCCPSSITNNPVPAGCVPTHHYPECCDYGIQPLTTPTVSTDDLKERLQKLANIKKN